MAGSSRLEVVRDTGWRMDMKRAQNKQVNKLHRNPLIQVCIELFSFVHFYKAIQSAVICGQFPEENLSLMFDIKHQAIIVLRCLWTL